MLRPTYKLNQFKVHLTYASRQFTSLSLAYPMYLHRSCFELLFHYHLNCSMFHKDSTLPIHGTDNSNKIVQRLNYAKINVIYKYFILEHERIC